MTVDANLLIYAYNRQAPQHAAARAWLEARLTKPEAFGIPWEAVLAFLRITTQRGLLPAPFSMEEAIAHVDSWLAQPQVVLLLPDESAWPTLRKVLLDAKVAGRGVTDAQIAATALSHSGILYSTDRDFARFPGLRWINPLQTP